MGRDSQICACQLARSKSAEGAALCPSDMMLCVISYWVLSGAKRRQIQQLRCCAFPAQLLKRRNVYLKLTRHNGRAGAHGTYNPKHNDRSFNLANSEHIDPERAKGNIYWDCFHGFRSALDPQDPDDLAATFSDGAQKQTVRITTVACGLLTILLMCLYQPVLGACAAMGGILTFGFYYRMSMKQFGGITGDLAGFFLQICELVMAFCVVAGEILLRKMA